MNLNIFKAKYQVQEVKKKTSFKNPRKVKIKLEESYFCQKEIIKCVSRRFNVILINHKSSWEFFFTFF